MRCVAGYAPLSGSIIAPPSKSHSMRAILFATMAKGKSVVYSPLSSPDTVAMVRACQQLGADIPSTPNGLGDCLEIIGVAGKPQLPRYSIDAGNSGQVLRFVGAMVALLDKPVVLTGDHSLRTHRPIAPLRKGLSDLGAVCRSLRPDQHLPLVIQGPIAAGQASLDGADSQPVSGLLMVSAFLQGKTRISVKNPGEKPWIDLTLSWLDRLGIPYTNQNYTEYTVAGTAVIPGFNYVVPGDFSAMAYPMVAALITQSCLTIENLDIHDVQGDKKIIPILQKMGADICVQEDRVTVKPSGRLIGCAIDVNDCIDALPILAVLGCYAEGTTLLYNAGIARCKESDRLATMTVELRKMGAHIQEEAEALVIQGTQLQAAQLSGHEDHRVALSLIVAALGLQQTSTITQVSCMAKSYPYFVEAMRSLGACIKLLPCI